MMSASEAAPTRSAPIRNGVISLMRGGYRQPVAGTVGP